MATIDFGPDSLIVRLHGWDRIFALRASIEVPLVHILGVRVRPEEANFDTSVYDPSIGVGLYERGKVALGSLRLPDGIAFFDVRDPERTIAVDLWHEEFKHVIIEVDDEAPEQAAERIDAAVRRAASMAEHGRDQAP